MKRSWFLALTALAVVAILIGSYVVVRLNDDENGNDKEDENGPDHNIGGEGPETVEGILDTSNATGEGINEVIGAGNQFGFDVYLEIAEDDDGNIFISPYSLFTALSMTYEGARGQTADEMADVLHLPDDEDDRRGSFASVQNGISSGSENYNLSTANSIWPQYDMPFEEDFFDIIRWFYYGEVNEVDYTVDPDAARTRINEWVENETNDKIKDLIPQGMIDPLTVMVLTNAIYFKSQWARTFDDDETEERDFHLEGGGTVSTPMMISGGEDSIYNYTETDDLQVLELPYTGYDLSMLVLLPKDDDITSMENDISWEMVRDLREDLREEEVNVAIPKFKLETKYLMKEMLMAMGMPTAFSPGSADFTGMLTSEPIWISQVIHQGFIEVDEEGTEAAAATAVIMERYSAVPEYETFTADHPFMFLIQERDTGNILFMGKVSDPTA